MSEIIHLYLSWASRQDALDAASALLGTSVEAWPAGGEISLGDGGEPIRYSAIEFPPIVDDTGAIVPGFHVGLWLYATPEQAALAGSLGATVRLEPDLPDWWPRLG